MLVLLLTSTALTFSSIRDDAKPPPFPVFARWEGGAVPGAREALLRAGITGFVVGAADAAAIAAIGDSIRILDGAAAPDALFGPSDYEATFEDYLVTRDPRFAVREHCPLGGREAPFAAELASAIGASGPLFAVSLRTDPSWTSRSAPHDLCLCEACAERWRRDLAARFSDPAAAAAAFGLEAGSFAEFVPWSVDRVRAWNEDLPRARVRLGPWLDHRSTLDEVFSAVLGQAARAAADRTGKPAGFLGGALTNAFGGHDWARLARAVELLQPPEDPSSREVALAHGAKIVFGALNPTAGEQRFARRLIADALFAGVRGMIVANWRAWIEQPSADAPFVPTKLGRSAAPLLAWARGEAGDEWRRARPREARVKLLYSPRSLKIHWLIDAEPAGIYWPSLAAHLDGELLPLARTWWGWQWFLQDLQRPYSWLDESELESEADPLAGLEVLVLPRVISLSARAESRIREFVARGGRLLIDGECGLFDEHGNGLARGRLDDLASVLRDDESVPWDAARPGLAGVPFASLTALRELETRAAAAGPSDPAVLWLDLSMGDYVDVRSAATGDRGAALLDRVASWLGDRGGKPEVRVVRKHGGGPAGVKLHLADAGSTMLVGVTRTEVPPELIDPKAELPVDVPVEYVLELGAPRIVDDLSPAAVPRDAAPTTRLEFALPIEGCALFRIREPR